MSERDFDGDFQALRNDLEDIENDVKGLKSQLAEALSLLRYLAREAEKRADAHS